VALSDDLARIADTAAKHAGEDEQVAGILVAEPRAGERTYLCSYSDGRGRTWLALDARGDPVTSRNQVRQAVSIAALCEVAEESAGGGELEGLRGKLLALRISEAPPGIEEAEAAALALETTIGSPPRIASPAYLDAVGSATRRLEQALGSEGASPFAVAMQQALGAVEELTKEVESGYKLALR
jgi:hypothetical protein